MADTLHGDREHRPAAIFPLYVGTASAPHDSYFREILDQLPAAIYTTDPEGRITYFNEAAAGMWGHRPELGKSEWCGSWKLFWPDGKALAHGDCPMALAIKEKRANRGMEAIAERPDGSRVPFIPYPTPLFDSSGALIGAVNMLVDITDRKRAEEIAQRMAALVASSNDAIISKDLSGIIASWNDAAERMYGYTAKEVIGKSVTILIPPDRTDEETHILEQIGRGKRVDHYETVRQHKDGRLIEVSLTVSPIMDSEGKVIGASKIARDISHRKRAQEQQHLLLREMDHRVKNLFALASGVVTLSARSGESPKDWAATVRERLGALARAHALTLSHSAERSVSATTLHALIGTIVAPYEYQREENGRRVTIKGPDIPLSDGNMTSLALLLHEFATNAAKYGALSTLDGRIEIDCSEVGNQFVLMWEEHGGPRVARQTDREGFGSFLARSTVKGQLGGEITRDWKPEGLCIRLSVDRDRLLR